MTSKVFVGNLAFQTTDQALAEAFQDCGKVKSGVVITRGRRSLGYGFVEFETHDSALEAVKTKNNTQLKGRILKVEIASDNPPVRSSPDNQQDRGLRNSPSSSNPDNTGAPAARRKPRNIRVRQPRRMVKPVDSNNPIPSDNPKQPFQRRPSPPPPSTTGPMNPREKAPGDNLNTYNNPRGPPRPRRRFQKNNNQNVEDRVLSKTAVFVANLPFGVKDEELLQFFKDNNPKTAHVVVTRNGRSRGYGFVDFDAENDQLNAINSKNNLKFPNSERQITVTPSYKTQEVQLAAAKLSPM
jgi:RNA recognition motif-containing protein